MTELITPDDRARHNAVENAVHVLAPGLGLAGPAVAQDIAARAIHAGAADSVTAGVRLPSGETLESYIRTLKDDPATAHFWRRAPESEPAKAKPYFDGLPRKQRATAKLDAANGGLAVKL